MILYDGIGATEYGHQNVLRSPLTDYFFLFFLLHVLEESPYHFYQS